MRRRRPACLGVLAEHDATLLVHLPDGVGVHLDMLTQLAKDYPALTVYVPHVGWRHDYGLEPSPNERLVK